MWRKGWEKPRVREELGAWAVVQAREPVASPSAGMVTGEEEQR